AREPLRSLHRADYVLGTKSDSCQEDTVYQLENRGILDSALPKIRYEVFFEQKIEDLLGKKIMLVSAIGNHKQFENSVRATGIRPMYHKIFRDHYSFTPKSVELLKSLMKVHGAEAIVTTAKDWSKLNSFCGAEIQI